MYLQMTKCQTIYLPIMKFTPILRCENCYLIAGHVRYTDTASCRKCTGVVMIIECIHMIDADVRKYAYVSRNIDEIKTC